MLQIFKTTKNSNAGYSLVEMIVYIAILSVIVSALVTTAISLIGTFAYLRGSQDVAETSMVALERISREIRFANSVDQGASTLGSSPGVLVLNTIDSSENPAVITFSLTGGRIMLTENGVTAPLTRGNVLISTTTFTYIENANSKAVKVQFSAETSVRGTTIAKDFRTFVVLKG